MNIYIRFCISVFIHLPEVGKAALSYRYLIISVILAGIFIIDLNLHVIDKYVRNR